MGHARQPALDVVRGIAILSVLLFHFRLPLGSPVLDAALQPVFAVGWIGVDLFFVLSGFLVGRMILVEAAATGTIDRRRFFIRRAWRLWPVLWLYCGAILLLGGSAAWAMVWPVLLHVQNYAGQAPSHLWSLAVEEHFYLGAALLVPVLLHGGGHRRVQRVLLAIMALCLLLRLLGLARGVPMLHLQWQTQYRLDAPAFGVLMASWSLHRPQRFAAMTRVPGAWLALAIVGTIVVAAGGDGAFRHGFGFTLAYLSAGALLMAAIGQPVTPTATWPAARLAVLGVVAYPVYIWHASIGTVVRALDMPPGCAFVVAGVAAIAVGAALHRWVERPAMQWRNRPARPVPGINAIAKQSRQ